MKNNFRFLVGCLVCLAVLALVGCSAVPNEKPQPTIFVKGFVTDEENKPVADAVVYAAAMDYEKSQRYVVQAETRSDAAGHFAFPALPAKLRGPASAKIYADFAIYAGKQGLAWGERRLDFDGAADRPAQAGFTDARVTLGRPARFRGRVVDAEDRPIAGARVTYDSRCLLSFLNAPDGRDFLRAISDQEGRFHIDDVQADSWCYPAVEAEGFASIDPWMYQGMRFWLGTMMSVYPVRNPIEVFEVSDKEIEIRLHPESRIEGVVSNKDGTPVAGTTVSVSVRQDSDANGVGWAYLGPRQSAVTDTAGRFALKGLREGHYRVHAIGGPFKNSWLLPMVSVELARGQTLKDMQIKEMDGIAVYGRVLDKETGKPIPQARLSGTTENYMDHKVISNGAFEVWVPRRRQKLSIYAEGYVSQEVNLEITDLTDQKELRVADVLLMGPQPPKEGELWHLLIVDEDGKPVPEATVRAGGTALGVSDENGRAELIDPPGNQQDKGPIFRITSPNGKRVCRYQAGKGPPENNAELRITLQKLCSVTGLVKDAGGRPIKGIRVAGVLWSEKLWTMTDENGRYTLANVATPGDFCIVATRPELKAGFGAVEQKVDLVNPGAVVVAPDLVPPFADQIITGRFVDEQAKPVAGVRFAFLGRSGIYPCMTDAQGRFEIKNVVRENVNLCIMTYGLWTTGLKENQFKDAVIRLTKDDGKWKATIEGGTSSAPAAPGAK